MHDKLTSGLSQAAAAYILWGLFPLYWALLAHIAAIEVMAHRVLWSFIFLLLMLLYRRRLYTALVVLGDKKNRLLLTASAFLVSVNWSLYIWSVTNGYVIEASMGYYITPLVNILLGAVFLGERLRRFQYLAVAFAIVGVLVMTLTYGRIPWIALTLAVSFGFYSLLRKYVQAGAQTALLVETGLILLPALLYLIFAAPNNAIITDTWGHKLLLIGGGVVTSLPLIFLANGLKVLTLSAIGFLQYISPTLQLLCGVFVFHETFDTGRLASFAFIWLGLAIYTGEALLMHKFRRHSDTGLLK